METSGFLNLRRTTGTTGRLIARLRRGFSNRIHRSAPYHLFGSPERYERTGKTGAADVFHLHGVTGWIGERGIMSLLPKEAKVFWTMHDVWPISGGCVVYQGCDAFGESCNDCPILRKPWQRIARNQLRAKMRFARSQNIWPIANSAWMADKIRASSVFGHLKKVPVIHPIIDNAYLDGEIPSLRGELQIPSHRFVISLGARSLTDPFKGVEPFLSRLSADADLPGLSTVILFGAGVPRIPDNLDVRLLGTVIDRNRLAAIYRTSDIFVSPSQMETFGMALTEAQAVGTPVAAFDVGGVRDAICDSRENILIPPQQHETLVLRLREAASNRQVSGPRQSLRSFAAGRFGAKEIGRKQLEVYRASSGIRWGEE